MSDANDPRKAREDGLPDIEVLTAEREVLRALCLCKNAESTPRREEQFRLLARHRFHDPNYQILFDTLCELFALFPASASWQQTIQEHLLPRLTQKGFPDLDLEPMLRPGSAEEGETQRYIRHLTGTR